MKKDLTIILGLVLVIVGLLIFGKGYTSPSFFQTDKSPTSKSFGNQLMPLSVKSLVIRAEVADNSKERKKGLSKRESLAIGEGMLFVFDKKQKYEIWMKDMQFPIDIIWIDENKKIVDIAESVAIEPGRDDEELKIWRPRSEAIFILEINAGLVELHGLAIGDGVVFAL